MVSCLGSPVQSCCGEGGTLQTNHWPVWGALTVFRPHWVCPHLLHVCFPCLHSSGCRLLCREWALSCVHFPGLRRSGPGSGLLHKGSDSVGPVFFCHSRSKQLRQPGFLTSTLSSGEARLLPSPVTASVSRHAGPVRLVSLLGS